MASLLYYHKMPSGLFLLSVGTLGVEVLHLWNGPSRGNNTFVTVYQPACGLIPPPDAPKGSLLKENALQLIFFLFFGFEKIQLYNYSSAWLFETLESRIFTEILVLMCNRTCVSVLTREIVDLF